MTSGKSKVRRAVKTVGLLILIAAASWIVFQTNAVSFADVPRLGAEFEAIGTETGTLGLPSRVRHSPTPSIRDHIHVTGPNVRCSEVVLSDRLVNGG